MNNESQNPTLELGLVSLVKIPERGLFLASRSFTCPPGYYYCVFKNTSAGPEFIQNYGPNQQGKLEKEQDVYRVSVGGAPYNYEFRSPFSMGDGGIVNVDIQLRIKILDGVKVARWVVEEKVDPIKRFRQDISGLIDEEISSLEYSKVFIVKTKEMKLNNQDLRDKVKKTLKPDEYGLILDDIKVKIVLSPELKKKWDNDIAAWHSSPSNPENMERRKQELSLKKEIATLDYEENKLNIELDRDLDKLKQEQETQKDQRGKQKEDEKLERGRKLRRDEETERQSEIERETKHQFEMRQLESQANLNQETTEQRHQLFLEVERKIHERNLDIESLRHQLTSRREKDELENLRRKEEEREKIHQLRMRKAEQLAELEFQKLQSLQGLKISKLENEQRLLLTSQDQESELEHQYALLEYKGKEVDQELQTERARMENQEIHEERLARIELGKELVRARLAIIDRISTGESKLTPEQIKTLIGIDPMNERGIQTKQIAEVVEAIDDYLSSDSGSERIRSVLNQLSSSKALTADSKALGQLESPKASHPAENYSNDEIAFTAYHPQSIDVSKSYSMLVYAYLPSLWEDIRRDAQFFLGELGDPKETSSDSPTRLKRGTEITIVPVVDGVTFNPERSTIKWIEDIERVQFRMRADASKVNTSASGCINVFVGPIIVASMNISIRVEDTAPIAKVENRQEVSSRMAHEDEIFISYSHKDVAIAQKIKEAYRTLGFTVLIDSDTLRAGQDWNEELRKMIERSRIFQLCWSRNAKKSKSVQQEWQYALELNKETGFIRPVYWDQPLPEPPNELSRIHFQYMQFGT